MNVDIGIDAATRCTQVHEKAAWVLRSLLE